MTILLSSKRACVVRRAGSLLVVLALIAGIVGCMDRDEGEFMGGSGTAADPYQVGDWYHLDNIRYHLDAHFVLVNDLDAATAGYEELAGPEASDGKGWEPIQTPTGEFTGSFDGQGYEVRDLFIDGPRAGLPGLFSVVREEGVVENLGVVNANVAGNSHVGALVGLNAGTVSNCYSTGSVTGDWYVGGLVGLNFGGSVSTCYSAASVSGGTGVPGMEGAIGGLVGANGGAVVNSYSAGSVTGPSHVGGLVGWNLGTVSNSYYNHAEVLINGENIITIGALSGADFQEWLANDRSLDVNERLSVEGGYYLISDITDFKQLLAFGQDSSLKFRLQAELDLSNAPGLYIPYLAGEFHGNGHEISNLSFSFDFVSHVGLFGLLDYGGKVIEVGVENADMTGFGYVAGLVGENRGTVRECSATGKVTGYEYVGGLVGFNAEYEGAVSNSYSRADVTGRREVGGLVGWNPVGGTVRSSYSTGSVTGEAGVGGLVGYNRGSVTNSFWDVETSGMHMTDGGTGKTTTEMMDIATFTRWDIAAVDPGQRDDAYTWNIVDGETYPFLSWEPVG
ncbi:MAG: hypothetical protein IBX67_07360 [Dehalococcoidia bacterium]|nr:hypothetical protein [Dehalococcoidia bacterium]